MYLLRNRLHAICFAAAALAGLTVAGPVYAIAGEIPDAGIDQRLDTELPLDLAFRDEAGQLVTLGDIIDGSQPAVLALVYYECTMLCGEVLNGKLAAFRELDLGIGTDFQVITVSFDPSETHEIAAPKKRVVLESYDREGGEEGWHFLTNEGDSAKQLANAVGFRYTYLPDIDEYAHGSAIILVTPNGIVSRYFFGVDYPMRDLRFALIDAGEGKVGSLADQILFLCMYYDPESGMYTIAVMRVLQLAGGATALVLACFVITMLLRERRRAPSPVVCES